MTIYNLAEYQKAKIVVDELNNIHRILLIASSGLKKYDHYRPVQAILTTIYNEKALMDIYLEQYKIIVETKGQRGV